MGWFVLGALGGCKHLTTIEGLSEVLHIRKINSSSGAYRSVKYFFIDCFEVSSGILDAYNYLSSVEPAIGEVTACFRRCGRDSETGSAELAQIPSDWK